MVASMNGMAGIQDQLNLSKENNKDCQMNLADKITKNSQSLKMGMQGDLVKVAQLELARRGFKLTGTGYYGAATDTAVSAVQRRAKLWIDGELGPATAKAIDAMPLAVTLPTIEHAEISRPLWIEAGLKVLGTHEGVGARDNKEIIDWAKEEGGDIAAEYTHDSIPWCALFANHILTEAGEKGTGTLWALDFAGKWPSIKLSGPAVGAFAPMKRSGGGHITCIVGKDQHGNVMGLGGNQSDAVTIAAFSTSRLNQGFWWPKNTELPKNIGFGSLPIINSNGKLSSKEF
jgi:uncharacterized protein (TIGR02594 family)